MSSTTTQSHRQRRQRRPPFRAARAFYLTFFIGVCFATFAIFSSTQPSPPLQQNVLGKRGIGTAVNEDERCRLVHHAKDQCAFVKSECPAEEPGFSAYLDLYYCRLGHAKPVAFIILISWLALLFSTIGIAASDFFCINLSTIAAILGMSESMAGVTFLAFGNGSPDVFSTFAAMSTNSGSLAVGELFGAAGFITAVVSGSMALIRPFHVARKSFVRDVGFFVVAAAFSIVFLWDGKLHFWECITMVVYYVFYVTFVVAWHWWLGRRRRRREKEAAARGHFVPPGEELEVEEEEYHDDPDESAPRPGISRSVSREDWSALERGGDTYQDEPDEDEEEEARERWMSELNSNMRLTRPPARSRKNTLTPVRPSLVGALEFQAVLKSLQKSRNIQTYPMNVRRYSDDPTYTTAQQQDQMSTVSDPASRPPYQLAVHDDGQTPTMERNSLDVPSTAPAGRMRSASTNAAAGGLRVDSDLQRWGTSEPRTQEPVAEENLIDFSERDVGAQSHHHSNSLEVPGHRNSVLQPPSPTIEISPAPPSRVDTGGTTRSSDNLAPPDGSASIMRVPSFQPDPDSPTDSPRSVPRAQRLPKIVIPGRTRSHSSTPSSSPFPRFCDEPTPPGSRPPSIYLPPAVPIASPESLPAGHSETPKRPTLLDRWWPYATLPPPGVLISTLFPTIYHWHEKNYWEKALGVVAAPSVFLLTVTLPVVESGKDEDDNATSGEGTRKDGSLETRKSLRVDSFPPPPPHEDANTPPPGLHRHASLSLDGAAGLGGSAGVAKGVEQREHHNYGDGAQTSTPANITGTTLSNEPDEQQSSPPDLWNRWLLIIQLFLAPLFIVLAIYSQSPTNMTARWLVRPTLICLLVSLVLLIPLLLTTTPTHKPAIYRPLLSLAGFVVSISWISTIASQVVGALKALAVILNMSHAIMGLTIFAVGNSLGDLVADVTVARLGYPVMALSACFGGPMLNILLGIGLSGSWILLRGANKRAEKHPDKGGLKFHAYHIEVSNTLIVSGATLLVTLVGLLVVVPLNKWVLSRRVGWMLIAVWVVSTVGNVVLEVSGVGESWGSEDMAGAMGW